MSGENNPAVKHGGQPQRLVFGSRTSKLALWQTAHVSQALQQQNSGLICVTREMQTKGDLQIDQPLPEIGGKGLFTAELDRALLAGEIDVAVHSLKDLPTQPTQGLVIIPVLARELPNDVLVTRDRVTLDELAAGARIGTSSYRRQAQLLALRSDLSIESIRGNVPTRISKVNEGLFDAVVLAAAGVNRLGCQSDVAETFSIEAILPAPGQGAIAATCRADDVAVVSLLETISDQETRTCVEIERELLALLGGGCSAPIGAYAQPPKDRDGVWSLMARVSGLDGQKSVTGQKSGGQAVNLAKQVAAELLEGGASDLLNSF